MNYRSTNKGFSLIELLVVIGVISVISAFSFMALKQLYQASDSAVDQILANYRLTRSKAISNTIAYSYRPADNNTIVASYRSTCDGTDPWTIDDKLTLNLNGGAILTTTDWFLCINSRGFPDANINFQVSDASSQVRNIQVFLGGGIEAS